MGKVVKITKRKLRNNIAYVMNVPKTLVALLGEPKEVVLTLGVKDGKQVIIMEPALPAHQSKSDSPHWRGDEKK